MTNWFETNYNKLKYICSSVSKENDNDELLHFCIDICIHHKKFNDIEDEKGKIYFFTRVVLNNWKSNTSPYHMIYRKQRPLIIDYNVELPNIELEEIQEIDLQWVQDEIKLLKTTDWYSGRLFELYIEEGCSITKLNKRTTIPIAILSRDVNKVRKILNKKRKNILYGL
jgi:hypothetical protein